MSKDSNAFAFLNVDNLSGKLVVKAQLGNDLRVIPVYNEDITYDELLLMFQRVFHGQLKSTDEVTLKYKDQEGELITLADTNDLAYAKQLTRYLKIVVFTNGAEVPPVNTETVLQLKRELASIRNKVNALLEVLDTAQAVDTSPKAAAPPPPVAETDKKQDLPVTSSEAAVGTGTSQPVLSGVSSLFDPLQEKRGGAEKYDPFSSLATTLAPSTTTGSAPPPTSSQPATIEQESTLPSTAPAALVATSVSPSPTPAPMGSVQQPQAPVGGDTSSTAYLFTQSGVGGGASTASHTPPQSQSPFGSQVSVVSAASGTTLPPAQQFPPSSGTAPPLPPQQAQPYPGYNPSQPYYSNATQPPSTGYTPPTAPSLSGGYVPPQQPQLQQQYGGTAPYYPPTGAASAPPPSQGQGYLLQGMGAQYPAAGQMVRPGLYGQRGYQQGYK